MAGPTTQSTDLDARVIVAALQPEARRTEGERLLALFADITGEDPVVWGSDLIGFGRYHYRYASGREGDFFRTGFAARARDFVIYLMPGTHRYGAWLDRLGPHRCGKSCLYIKHLASVDEGVLRRVIAASVDDMRTAYPDEA